MTRIPPGATILALLLGGCPQIPSNHPDAGTDAGTEGEQLAAIAAAMKSFHTDTGGWPYENTVWDAQPNSKYPQIEPRPVSTTETSLFAVPTNPANGEPLPTCSGSEGGLSNPCWRGPYLTPGGSLGAAPWLDHWGNPMLYAYIRPQDGNGGGVSSAPNGAIVIWSSGPDGIDQTGCSTGACALDYSDLAAGKCSVTGCDDDIVLVSSSAE